jgi:hypothetical protein
MTIDDIRRKTLDQIDRSERLYRSAFAFACAAEVLVLGALLWAIDISNRTHVILLIGFVGSYSVILLAMVVLGAHVNRVGQRVLRAIELVR